MNNQEQLNKNKHLRNAETQMAVDLSNEVQKFIKSKHSRLTFAKRILVKARELAQAAELLNAPEVPKTPVPPLPDYLERGSKPAQETHRTVGWIAGKKYIHFQENGRDVATIDSELYCSNEDQLQATQKLKAAWIAFKLPETELLRITALHANKYVTTCSAL